MKMQPISRRTVLRGLGTAMALPLLDAMTPSSALGAPASAISSGATGVAAAAPKRMAFFFVPNGVNPDAFFPSSGAGDLQFTPTLEPLKPLKDYVTLITGLRHEKAKPNGDGAGDHARSAATFLTGAQARKTSGANIEVGVSADQFAAQQIGEATRLGSLQLGSEPGKLAGNCDSGYSCAYSNTISWRTPNTPVPHEINPRLVFERLFGDASVREVAAARAKRDLYKKSILDLVADDAKSLNAQLGSADQQKLAQYLDSVRDVEKRIEIATRTDTRDLKPQIPIPQGVPSKLQDHLRLLGDMLVLAFQADLTRISTFMIANEGSNRSYTDIGVREGHHSLSHHGRSETKLKDIAKINLFHMQQFAYVLQKMKDTKEGAGNLLDNTMCVYGCAIRDGDRHDHTDLPVVMAGKGGGTIKTGVHLQTREPMTNLFLSLFDRLGVKADRLGDSTGRCKVIDA